MEKQKVLYNLGSIQRIPPGEGRVFTIEGEAIAIFRTREQRIYATQASCPHNGGPLADGLVGTENIICPLHAYMFNLKTGKSLTGHCNDLKTFPVWLNAREEIQIEREEMRL